MLTDDFDPCSEPPETGDLPEDYAALLAALPGSDRLPPMEFIDGDPCRVVHGITLRCERMDILWGDFVVAAYPGNGRRYVHTKHAGMMLSLVNLFENIASHLTSEKQLARSHRWGLDPTYRGK